MDENLRSLVARAWAERDSAARLGVAVEPSSPILWFGDLDAYRHSSPKVITVGLNPSRFEFPKDDGGRPVDPYCRFPAARGMTLDSRQDVAYVEALNRYFRERPYLGWFNSLEPVLNGLGATFGHSPAAGPARALHTDLGSVAATDPVWSRLPSVARENLRTQGFPLWRALVKYLAPDIIVASVARAHLDQLDCGSVEQWTTIITITEGHSKPYPARATRWSPGSGHETLVVFGRAAEKPFGTVKNADRQRIGEAALRYWRQDA